MADAKPFSDLELDAIKERLVAFHDKDLDRFLATIERLQGLVERVSILMRWQEMDSSLEHSEIDKAFPKNYEDSKKELMEELRQALDRKEE